MTLGKKQTTPAAVLVDLALLALASLLFALSFPSFLSDRGWFPLGFVCLIPVFVVVHRARWAAIPFYGIFFGYVELCHLQLLAGPVSPPHAGRGAPDLRGVVPADPAGAEAGRQPVPVIRVPAADGPVGLLRVLHQVQGVPRLCLRHHGVHPVPLPALHPGRRPRRGLGRLGARGLPVGPGRQRAEERPRGAARELAQADRAGRRVARRVRRGGRVRPARARGHGWRPAVEGRPRPAEHRPVAGRVHGVQGLPAHSHPAQRRGAEGRPRPGCLVGNLLRARNRLAHALPDRPADLRAS